MKIDLASLNKKRKLRLSLSNVQHNLVEQSLQLELSYCRARFPLSLPRQTRVYGAYYNFNILILVIPLLSVIRLKERYRMQELTFLFQKKCKLRSTE